MPHMIPIIPIPTLMHLSIVVITCTISGILADWCCFSGCPTLRAFGRVGVLVFSLRSMVDKLDCPKSQAGEFGEKLIGGSEMEGIDAKAGCGKNILMHVVDEHSFVGHGTDFAQRVVIDHG